MTGTMQGKTVVVMGVANKWSLAWGISQVMIKQGATMVYTYLGEKAGQSIERLLEEAGTTGTLIPCDVSSDADIEKAFKEIAAIHGTIHGLVHSVAYSNKDELRGDYHATSREGYHLAHDISVYSLVKAVHCAVPLMTEGGSVVTLTYLGGERVVKNYNIMGVSKAALEMSVRYLAHDLGRQNIRVNAISAGPAKTVAAKGVGDFGELIRVFEEKAPLGRVVTLEEVGNAAFFLLSDLGSAVTGEVLHVDCGYNILGY